MAQSTGNATVSQGMRRRPLILVGALVGLTLLYLWKKVELARIAQRLVEIESEMVDLREEDARLRAAIDQYSKPGTIKRIAEEKLGMIYPTGQVDELILENEGGNRPK